MNTETNTPTYVVVLEHDADGNPVYLCQDTEKGKFGPGLYVEDSTFTPVIWTDPERAAVVVSNLFHQYVEAGTAGVYKVEVQA